MQNLEFRTGVIKPIDCVKEAWEIIKPDYWLLFAVTIVGVLIGSMTLLLLTGGMICGIYYVYLRKIDGGPVVFDDLWKGFSWFLPGLVVAVFIFVPVFVVYGAIYVPIVMAAIAGKNMSESELITMLAGALAVDLIFVIVMVCFHTLILFAFPLIVDRGVGPVRAMIISSKAVWKNLGGIAGLYGVNLALSLAGAALCGVGAYLVIPIIFASNVVAYRKIFPSVR